MIKSRSMKWAVPLLFMREARNSCRVLVRKPEGKETWKTKVWMGVYKDLQVGT
jgi:hypothetical protein